MVTHHCFFDGDIDALFGGNTKIYAIQLETNARNVEHSQSWVNNKRFNHMQHVALGALVMLTKNIDLKVGATNGTTRIVTKLEFDL
jgi:hypothetical protein